MSLPDPELSILDALDSGIVVLDQEGRITAWNGWMASASEHAVAAALGLRLHDLFPDARIGRLNVAVRDALELGASSLLSHQLNGPLLPLKTRAGRTLLHNIAVRPIGQKPYGRCLIQVLDVTIAAERERVLRERQNARYDAVVESATDPIVTLDGEGVIQLANPAAAREFGVESSALIGRPFAALLDQPESWDQAWKRLIEGSDLDEPLDLAIRRFDGSLSYVEASAACWRSEARKFVTAILRDVNERRAAEAEMRRLYETLELRVAERTVDLERAHEQLRQSQKMEAIGQLTGGVAHDFNNLLTPIVGGLDVLNRRGGLDERGRALIEGALQSAERARVLVQRLLAFSRRQPLQSTAVDIAALVRDMTDLLGGTIGPLIRIVVELPEGLPPAQADRNQVEMALLNLAVNARDAMPDGGALTISAQTAEVGRSERLNPGRYVRLAVTDTGVGMDAAILARAVEPFFSTKGIGKGTGLGLSMIHGLSAQLGGTLEISSTPGVGTKVEMWLPAAVGATWEDAARAQDAPPPGEGMVLLVDDEDLIRTSTSQMLADLGFTVVEASSAHGALASIADPRLTLVVTDHLMPGMTGAELAREVQARRPEVRVLIISGFAELDAIAPDLARLMKPFREAELAAALAALQPRA